MSPTVRLTSIASMLALVATLFVSAPADAATITYSQRFFLTARNTFPDDPSAPDGLGASPRVERFLSDFPEFAWAVPAFDPSLGVATSLTLELDGQASIRGRIPFGDLFAFFDVIDPIDGMSAGEVTATTTCASGCKFSGSTILDWSQTIAYNNGDPTITWLVGQSADRFATWESGAWGDIKTASVGVMRAIYTYQPASATVGKASLTDAAVIASAPEPATLLLCATGLAGLAWRRRSRR
jgi:PEP-CTERM motif